MLESCGARQSFFVEGEVVLESCGARQSFFVEGKGRFVWGRGIQLIGIASKALRCQADSLRVSCHTFLKRLHRPVTGIE